MPRVPAIALVVRLTAVVLAALGTGLPAGAADVSKEYQVKAAFLFNIAKFVEWPPERRGEDHEPVVIAVFRHNPFGSELARMVEGRQVNGHPIAVRTVTNEQEIAAAHLVFVPDGQEEAFAGFEPAAAKAGVLTCGESEKFAAVGVISFLRQGDKVRFVVNLGAADRHHLKLSAQLLKLAQSVRRED
ncbi:MAG TPA: YfiR family protein [Opitutaceae bacterium]|nr:YfiR family protein [Opitutaceae bacterium]